MGETRAKKTGLHRSPVFFANKSLVFENLGDLLETLGNIDFLGALSLALQAVDAGGSHTLILDGVLIGVLGALEAVSYTHLLHEQGTGVGAGRFGRTGR